VDCIDLYLRIINIDTPSRSKHCVMESIKNAIGLGSGQVQSGQEPVSGETGSGTVSEPYDAGNATGKSRHQNRFSSKLSETLSQATSRTLIWLSSRSIWVSYR